jgi:hypothetical protein
MAAETESHAAAEPPVLQHLPLEVVRQVAAGLERPDLAAARLVCTAWRACISEAVVELQPRGLGRRLLAFPNLETLQACLSPWALAEVGRAGVGQREAGAAALIAAYFLLSKRRR